MKASQHLGVEPLGGLFNQVRFEQDAKVVDLLDLDGSENADHGARVRMELDEAVGRKRPQACANRHSAQPERLGDDILIQTLTRPVEAPKDGGTEKLCGRLLPGSQLPQGTHDLVDC